MDHWGDPWADADADDADTKTTAKNEEVKAQPAPLPSPLPLPDRAPIVLNGFLDDAGWGAAEEEEDFGGWASSTNGGGAETRVLEQSTTPIEELQEDTRHGSDLEEKGHFGLEDEGWGALTEEHDFLSTSEKLVSEASDSATTVQADEIPARHSVELGGVNTANHDDGLSTRPSSSPSDISHTEAPTESPRTSFEDERIHRKHSEIAAVSPAIEGPSHTGDKGDVVSDTEQPREEAADEDGFDDFEDDGEAELEPRQEQRIVSEEPDVSEELPTKSQSSPQEIDDTIDSTVTIPAIEGLDLDWTLLNDLFPPTKSVKKLGEPPEDPLHSTSARKAWYRLTRKQTMREFNNGGNDDNYIRVTWASSRIKQDAVKIVGRWANEGRMSARGNAAGGMFNWDRPAASTPNAVSPHVRKKSLVSASSVPIQPTAKVAQPLATDVPAAFSWSSPMATSDPWNQDNSSNRAVSSPITAKHTAITRLQGHSPRSVSVDLPSRGPVQTSHKRTNTAVVPDIVEESRPAAPSVTPSVDGLDLLNSAPSQLPPPPATEAFDAGNWDDLSALDPPAQPPSSNTVQDQQKDIDDDDEWGEMVESPATPTLPIFPPNPLTPTQPTSTAVSSPAPTVPSSSPWASATPRDALPVTRLKGAVSPTTANFKFNSFVPEGTIDGPIGPGLLKKSRSMQSTPEKGRIVSSSALKVEVTRSEDVNQTSDDTDEEDDFAEFESSVPNPDTSRPVTASIPSPISTPDPIATATSSPAPPPPPVEPPSDALDFSIFESNTPSIPSQPQPVSDPSDPWSIFDTPAPPPPPPAPEPVPFVRPPTKSMTPPPLQPLTGATNLAQKRKEEEEETIRSIVHGLPNLTYMLRR